MPLHAIPYAAPVTVSHGGLLNSPDWWVPLAYGLVLLLALCCVPGQLRESAKALWAPAAAFLRRLYVPWLWEGLFIAGSVLCVLRALYGRCQYAYVRCTDAAREQLRRLAFSGFMRPVLT